MSLTGSATNLSALVTIDDGYDTLSDAIANIDEHAEQMQGQPVGQLYRHEYCRRTRLGVCPIHQRRRIQPCNWPRHRALSDGQPNGFNNPWTTQELKDMAVLSADNLAAEGISTFTVSYNQGNNPEAAAFLASLARGDGIALETPDADELPTLLWQICATLPLRLVQ